MTKRRFSHLPFRTAAVVFSATAIWAAGCVKVDSADVPNAEGSNGNTDGGGTSSGPGNGEIPSAVTITGFIKNSQGVPVADAEIDVGTVMSASSDTNGLFDVDTAPAGDSVILTINAPEHAPQVVKVRLKPGVLSYAVPVLMQRLQTIAIDQGAMETQLFIGDTPATVTFDQPMGDPATLQFVSIDAPNGPGDLRFIDSPEDEAMQSGGMLWFELFDLDGNKIPMPGGKVTLDLGGAAHVQGSGPWQGFAMPPAVGEWNDEKEPLMTDGTKLTLPLPESGYWDVGRVYPTACVVGIISSDAGDAGVGCGGARIEATGEKGLMSFDSIGQDGGFCLVGEQASTVLISLGEYQIDKTMPANNGSCQNLKTCRDIGTILIPPGGCDLVDKSAPPPPPVAIGGSCTSTAQCPTSSDCHSGFCIGTGVLRITLSFAVPSDFDLHLITPSGTEINYTHNNLEGGKLDVDQCAGITCDATTHVENIVFATSAPVGDYEVWVDNFTGDAGGPFSIEVSGLVEQTFMGTVDAATHAESQHFTFTSGLADGGAGDAGDAG